MEPINRIEFCQLASVVTNRQINMQPISKAIFANTAAPYVYQTLVAHIEILCPACSGVHAGHWCDQPAAQLLSGLHNAVLVSNIQPQKQQIVNVFQERMALLHENGLVSDAEYAEALTYLWPPLFYGSIHEIKAIVAARYPYALAYEDTDTD